MKRLPVFSLFALVFALASCTPTKPATTAPMPTRGDPSLTPIDPSGEPTAQPPQEPAAASSSGTLVLDGTPAIPDSLRSRLNQYLNTRSAGLRDLSSDGKRALIGTRFGETSQVHLLTAPGAARTQLTFGLEPARSPTFVPGSKDKILFASDSGGNEKQQLFVLNQKTGKTTRITDGKSVNANYVFSRDGKQLAMRSNRRNGKDFDVWVHQGATAEGAVMLVEGKGYYIPAAFSRKGDKLLVGEYISINDTNLYVVDTKSGKKTQINDAKAKSYNSGGPFASDGKSVFVSSDKDGEFRQIYRIDLASGKWTPVTADLSWDVESMALSPSGRTLAFSVNEAGVSKLYLYDTRTKRRRAARNIPAGILSGLMFATNAEVLGFSLSAATRSSDAYTYDVRRSRLTRWTESEIGGLNPETFVEPELIKFKSFDGKEISAFYYRPKGAGPFPVMINIHGGPESQTRPYFSSLSQFLLAESKIAVLYPNVRGSSGYGKSFLKLDNGFKREDSVKDIGALLDWVATRKELDAERACVFGGSYGGYMVLASLIHFGERLVCGIDVVGISDFVTFLTNTADYRRDVRRAEYGDERDPKMKAHLDKISPLRQADKIKTALFVAQGANDPRVPASEAEQIVAAVRKSGNDAWFMLAKDEGHGFAKRKNRDAYLLLSVLFLEKHLLAK